MNNKLFRRIAVFLVVICMMVLSCMPVFAAEETKTNEIIRNPQITLHNLQIRNGASTDVLWQNTSGTQDFDFGPGSDSMDNAYIEYEYSQIEKINGLDLIGWWPKNQAIKNISVFYEQNETWIPVLENYEIPWKTSAGSNGSTSAFANGEKLRIDFENPVATARLKIQIHSAYHSWSNKINMRLIAPTRMQTEAEKNLYEVIAEMKSVMDSILTGTLPGEFPEEALEALQQSVKNAETLLSDGNATEEDILQMIESLNQAKQEFYGQQIAFPEELQECRISLENLNVVSGRETFLYDRQLATGTVLQKAEEDQDGAIIFDFGGKVISPEKIQLLCENPTINGIKSAAIQYFNGTEWITVKENTALNWEGGYIRMEGRGLDIDEEIKTSKIRFVVNDTSSEDHTFSIQEIWVEGKETKNAESLEELIERAESLLATVENQDTKEADMVKLKLMSAKNEDVLSRATQKKIDYLYTELLAAVNQLDESLKDKISPSRPYDVRVESVTAHSAVISFAPSADNVAVAGYKVYSGENIIKEITAPENPEERVIVELSDLADDTVYNFVIKAVDTSGNLSEETEVEVTTKKEEIPEQPEQPGQPEQPEQPEQPSDINGQPSNGNSSAIKPSNVSTDTTSQKKEKNKAKAPKSGDATPLSEGIVVVMAAGIWFAFSKKRRIM